MSPQSREGGYPPSLRLLLRRGVPPFGAKSCCDCCCGSGLPPLEPQSHHCCCGGGYPPSPQSWALLRATVPNHILNSLCGTHCGDGGVPPPRGKLQLLLRGGVPPPRPNKLYCCCCALWYPLKGKYEGRERC